MRVTNQVLRRYLEVCQEIRTLELEKSVLSSAIKAHGELVNDEFQVNLTVYSQMYVTSVKGLIEKFGKRSLGKLIDEKECIRLTVKERVA